MPSWGEILTEINTSQQPVMQLDAVRKKYLVRLHQHTKRPVIVYATRWVSPLPNMDPTVLSVDIADIQGLMEVMKGIDSTELDLVIHSPGGSIDAAEAFVRYLRSKFQHIRAIVPYAAMSAATMICMACDEVVMGKHSFLGPIDPQFVMQTPLGPRAVPAQAIVEQFNKAQKEISGDQSKLASWIPMLGQFGPDLLIRCDNANALSKKLVEEWLTSYMLKDNPAQARATAEWLANHTEHKTHSRYLARETLQAKGIKILPLEKDETLQDEVLSLYHATTLTFQNTVVGKLIENHLGKCFLLMGGVPVQQPAIPQGLIQLLQMPVAPPIAPPFAPPTVPGS
ncbi:serine dehydrogenase proteinase [Paraburkholderia unamae]|uniref:SDH family Clp fold serine proteinase n=1 Tax=Paraburkholderia unamae TaxID=219649 RepID=UPI000DC37D27|nr:serine protease [Paraburkholderia unamae]RAR51700.1 serine dehydrogenase proteinase [Paraburkholderia unamae]